MSKTIAHMDSVVQRVSTPVAYRIIDGHTGKQVGKDYTYANRNRARSRADKLDNDYGSYRYHVRPVYSAE